MKKTPCSIGGYILRNVKKMNGHEGEGFTAELWKDKQFIGFLEDYGDGGDVSVNLNPKLTNEEKSSIKKDVHLDMLKLLYIVKASGTSLAKECWSSSPKKAMVGFGELLLELSELTKMAKKFEKKNEGKPYAIIQAGCSWFEPMSPQFEKTRYIALELRNTTPQTYIHTIKDALSRKNEEVNAAFLRFVNEGSAKWDLSFYDYAQLVELAKDFNSFKFNLGIKKHRLVYNEITVKEAEKMIGKIFELPNFNSHDHKTIIRAYVPKLYGDPYAIVILKEIEGNMEILEMEVTDDRRREGIGTCIVLELLQEFKTMKVVAVPESAGFWAREIFNAEYDEQIFEYITMDPNDSEYLLFLKISAD